MKAQKTVKLKVKRIASFKKQTRPANLNDTDPITITTLTVTHVFK